MDLWRCFWIKLTFESVDWVKQGILTNADKPHAIHWRPEQSKKIKGKFTLSVWLPSNGDQSSPALGLRRGLWFTPSALLFLRPSGSDWNYTIGFPGSPALTAGLGTSQPSKLHEPIPHYTYIRIYTYIYYWLFLPFGEFSSPLEKHVLKSFYSVTTRFKILIKFIVIWNMSSNFF